MAVSLDDKLLGEKAHYYCSSSSEDEADDSDDQKSSEPESTAQMPDITKYSGHSKNTGPKGVVDDWRRFKQLQNEQRSAQETERLALAKKLTLTCRTDAEETAAKQEEDDWEAQLAALEEDDEFIRMYRDKRLEELKKAFESLPRFGTVTELTGDSLVPCIDSEPANVIIVVHVYESRVHCCDVMNSCLDALASEYPTVKFCRITATDARMSHKFVLNGVPALLVYKAGQLIGNFIRLSDEFGQEFYPGDVANFLVERGLLPDKSLVDALQSGVHHR